MGASTSAANNTQVGENDADVVMHDVDDSEAQGTTPSNDNSSSRGLRFATGIPRVGFSRTVPVPADTVPVAGTGTHRTAIDAVSYETHGYQCTRGSYTSTLH
jgi:hypothetical protein